MKNSKRIMSFILAIVLLLGTLSCVPLSAFAATSSGYEYYRYQDNTIEILGYKGSAANITIPSQINGYPVTRIGSIAFSGCNSLKSVVIPDSVTSIGYAAFANCTKLQSVSLPNKLKSIETEVFSGCEKLSSIKLPDSVNYIGGRAFWGCTSLNNLVIGNNVTAIEYDAFYNCSSLNNITIGKNVKSIGDCAFNNTAYYNDSSNWENGVLYICNYLIDASNNISGSYTVKDGTIGLAEYAFSYCYELTGITIPKGTAYIGSEAFSSCNKLKKINLPDSISYIGNRVFDDTAYFANKSNWENGVLYIGKHLVSANNNQLNGFCTVKSGTVTIAGGAFEFCESLRSVTIPNSVKYISGTAFSECENLATVFYNGSKAQWSKISIDEANQYLLDAAIHYNYDPNATLDTPKIKSVSNTFLGVRITWGEVKGAAYYRVFRKTGNGSWVGLGNTDETDVIDISAESGKKYTYTIRCIASDGKTYQSSFDAVGKTITYIEAPFITQVANTATGMQIKWDKVKGAEKYRVFYKTAGGSWTGIANTTATSYTWTGAKSGTKYTFTVRCLDKDGNYISSFDSTGKSKTYVAAPKLSAVDNTASGVKISWGKVTGASKYRVFYKTAGGSWTGIANTTATSYTWTGAKSGTKYTFTVRCLDKDGNYISSFDSTGKSKTYVAAPKISSVENTTGVNITWGKVTGASKYRVFYKTAGGSWTGIANTTATSYTWKGAKSGTKYTFTVRCLDKDGNYISSFDSTGKSITYVAAPKLSAVTNTARGINISWARSEGAVLYRVYYKTAGGVWTKIADTTSTSFIWKEAKSGTRYTFTVRCINSNGTAYTSSFDSTGKTITR